MTERGDKQRQGKLPLRLVPPEAIEAIARALEYGIGKYGERNWEKGIPHTELYEAAFRHMLKYFAGETYDNESKLHAIDHALCDLAMLRAMIDRRPDLDDRPIHYAEIYPSPDKGYKQTDVLLQTIAKKIDEEIKTKVPPDENQEKIFSGHASWKDLAKDLTKPSL